MAEEQYIYSNNAAQKEGEVQYKVVDNYILNLNKVLGKGSYGLVY